MSDRNPMQEKDAKKQGLAGMIDNLGLGRKKAEQPPITANQAQEQQPAFDTDELSHEAGFTADETQASLYQKHMDNKNKSNNDTTQPSKPKSTNKLIIGTVATLGAVVLAGGLVAKGCSRTEPPPADVQVVEQAQQESQSPSDDDVNADPALHDVQANGFIGLDPLSAIAIRDRLPVDHWARSVDPIDSLAKIVTEQAVKGAPGYNEDIQGIYISDELVYGGMGEPFAKLVADVKQELKLALAQRVRVAEHQNQKITVIIANLEEANAGAPPERAVASAEEYASLETEARQYALQLFTDKINAIRASVPATPTPMPIAAEQVQQAPVQVVEDKGITEAQRREYNRLQERSNALIEELQTKNKNLLDEIAKKDKQMVQIMQKLEDSPQAQSKMKARMLETHTNMKVQAVQGDLVFLVDKNDKVYTVRIGDPLPGKNNLIVSNVDANTGIVYVTER